MVFLVAPSGAVPSFVKQTGQPCAACHMGAFGPQLKPYGRDFKLRGYTSTVEQDEGLRLAVIALTSFTERPAASGDTSDRKDLNFNSVTLFYAGKVFDKTGAFISATYDPVGRQLQLGKVDVRHVREATLFGRDLLLGMSVNNNPGVQDVWNSLPAFGFPFVRSGLAPRGKASTIFDGRLRGRMLGTSLYAVWDDFLQVEGGVYEGLTANMLEAIGRIPVTGADRMRGAATYSRLSLSQVWEGHSAQIGTFAVTGNIIPRGVQTFGRSNRYVDLGLDANYQYILNRAKASSDMLSASALFIRESAQMEASQFLRNAQRDGALETFRTNLSYSFAATVTPSLQYFRTSGSRDPVVWATANGRPDTEGMVYEVAYSPWGKPESPAPIPGLNARVTLQYTDYIRFDGSRVNARANNSIFIGLQTGLGF